MDTDRQCLNEQLVNCKLSEHRSKGNGKDCLKSLENLFEMGNLLTPPNGQASSGMNGFNSSSSSAGIGGGHPSEDGMNSIRHYFSSRNSTFDDVWSIAFSLSNDIGEQVLDVFVLTL